MSATQSTPSSVFSLVALTERQFPPRRHRRQPWQMLSLPWQGLNVYPSLGKTETPFFLPIYLGGGAGEGGVSVTTTARRVMTHGQVERQVG